MKRLNIIIIATLLLPSISYSDGNSLLEACQDFELYSKTNKYNSQAQRINVGYCLGFVQGVSSTMILIDNDKPLKTCFPKILPTKKSAGIVLDYLRKNPTKLQQHEVVLATAAFRDAFPCKK